MRKLLIPFLALTISLGGGFFLSAPNFAKCASTIEEAQRIHPKLLKRVLKEAAPHFGYTPESFFLLFTECNCVKVAVSSPSAFRVHYGGVIIEVLIEVS